jgi:hypothetical protein
MTKNELDQQAIEISKKLDSFEYLSPEYLQYHKEVVTPWCETNKRPLYYTYCND